MTPENVEVLTIEETRNATIEMSHISKRYSGVAALTDVSVTVLPGEVHAILGENGAGKSTLMNIATGTTEPDEGTITVCGQTVAAFTPKVATVAGHRDRASAPRRAPRHDGAGEPAGRVACIGVRGQTGKRAGAQHA